MKRNNQDMLSGPLLGGIIRYAIPVMLTSLLQLMFNAADLAIVGSFCGSVAVAAVGSTGSLTALIVNLFMGLSVGCGVMVAHGLGARQDTDVHRTVHTALPTALLGGGILTVAGILLSEPLLRLMGTPDTVLPLSATYMHIYFGGITFTMVYNYCAAILRAAGDTRSPLVFLGLSGVLNVVLNVFFVVVLHMNVAGVSLATVISQGVSAVLVTITLMRRTDACRLELKKLRFYPAQLLKMIRIGLPAGIQNSMFSISNVIIQSSINSFGDILMSGNAAASNLEGFLHATVNSFHHAALNFTGQNVGAHQYDRVKRILLVCCGCVVVLGGAASGLLYTFGQPLLGLYINDSAEAISWGMVRICYTSVPYLLFGLMDVASGALRGMGTSLLPMVISLLGVCGFRLLWIFTLFRLPQNHTPQFLYTSYPISWALTFAIQMAAFAFVYRRLLRQAQAPREAAPEA